MKTRQTVITSSKYIAYTLQNLYVRNEFFAKLNTPTIIKATDVYVGLGACEAGREVFQFSSKLHSSLTLSLQESVKVYVRFRVMSYFPTTNLQRKIWYSLSKCVFELWAIFRKQIYSAKYGIRLASNVSWTSGNSTVRRILTYTFFFLNVNTCTQSNIQTVQY